MLSWKGPIRIIKSNSQSCTGHPKSHTMFLRTFSKGFWNSVRPGAVTTSLFYCPTTL